MNIGILWSHNKRKHPYWLDDLRSRAKGIESQGFVWWDVGWCINFDEFFERTGGYFPVIGFIWNTVEKQVTHRTLIERDSKTVYQPEKELAKEAYENLGTLKVHVNENSPLLEYLRGKRTRKWLTLLKLIELEELTSPRNLGYFRLWDGKSILQPPEGYYSVTFPY